MKWLFVVCATLLPTADTDREPRPAPTRWPGKSDDRIPLPRLGVCPGGFEAWQWDAKRAIICIRRA